MDEITEYLIFMQKPACVAKAQASEAPGTPMARDEAFSPRDDEHALAEAMRKLLAEPEVLTALLRLARS